MRILLVNNFQTNFSLSIAGLLVEQRRRRWSDIKLILGERIVCAESVFNMLKEGCYNNTGMTSFIVPVY